MPKEIKFCYFKLDSEGKIIEGSRVTGSKPVGSIGFDNRLNELFEDFGMAYVEPYVKVTPSGYTTYCVGNSRMTLLP